MFFIIEVIDQLLVPLKNITLYMNYKLYYNRLQAGDRITFNNNFTLIGSISNIKNPTNSSKTE